MYKIFFYLFVPFFLASGISCKKSGTIPDPAPPPAPILSVADASEVRTTVAGTLRFNIALNKATTKIISVGYSLVDGTALAPQDYVSSSGTITIPANQTQVVLEVPIKGDPANLRQNN